MVNTRQPTRPPLAGGCSSPLGVPALAVLGYAVTVYVLFLGVLGYAIGFFADARLPMGVDQGARSAGPASGSRSVTPNTIWAGHTVPTGPAWPALIPRPHRNEESQ